MKRNKWLFAISSIFFVVLTTAFFSVVISEIAFYLVEREWYFTRNRPSKHPGDPRDMSLYRSPFLIKKGDRIRIVTIGGSTTYGFGVDSNLIWPKLLAKKLEKTFPGKYEVVNLGRLGGHLEEFIQNYQASSNVYISRDKWVSGERPCLKDLADWGWKDLQPDIIILVPVVNDTAPDFLFLSHPNVVSKMAHKILDIVDRSFIFENLALGFSIKKFLIFIEYKNKKPFPNNKQKLDIIMSEYKKNLERFIAMWGRIDRFYLLGIPLLFNKNAGEKQAYQAARYWNIYDVDSLSQEVHYLPTLEDLENKVRYEVSREKELLYREVGENIENLPFHERLRLYIDSIHMNSQGMKLIADEIYQFILEDRK